jgi:sporulation protein YlmC with PRC-barrel domain
MKTNFFDSLDEAEARNLTGRTVIDERGESVGTLTGLWRDATSRRVEFVGIRSSSSSDQVHVIPARDAQIIEEGNSLRLPYPAGRVKMAPSFSPGAALVQAEREKINKYWDRTTAPPRINSIEEIRPEEAIGPSLDENAEAHDRSDEATDRGDLEKGEQAFFDQKDFVTDSMPEVDASQELLRVQNEAKIRNREDRIKSGSLD